MSKNKEQLLLLQNDLITSFTITINNDYSRNTIVNPIVRFEPLFDNTYSVQAHHCIMRFFYVCILWWRYTCCLFVYRVSDSTGFNLCNVTALTLEPVKSGDPSQLLGVTAMSIPTNEVQRATVIQYCRTLFNLSITHCSDLQLQDIKSYCEVFAFTMLDENKSQSLKDKLNNQIKDYYLSKPARKILALKTTTSKQGGAI